MLRTKQKLKQTKLGTKKTQDVTSITFDIKTDICNY